MERRKFFKAVGLITAAAYVSPRILGSNQIQVKAVGIEGVPATEFPPLPFSYDALEPYIDARTMEIHYDKHHRAYFNNYVAAVKGTAYENVSVEKVFAEVSKAGDPIRNNGGGFYNHVFFWKNLGKGFAGPSAELSAALSS